MDATVSTKTAARKARCPVEPRRTGQRALASERPAQPVAHTPARAFSSRMETSGGLEKAENKQTRPVFWLNRNESGSSVQFICAAVISPDDLQAWERIAKGACEPNVFALPWMVLPALVALDPQQKARLAMVHNDAGALIGVMPVATAPRLGRVPLQIVGDWCHPNSFLSPICIADGAEMAFWQALLPALAVVAPRARLVALNRVAEGSTVHQGLVTAAAQEHRPLVIEQQIVRAMLAPDCDAEAYWQAAVRPKKRKELRRQWKRLNELGAIGIDTLAADGDVGAWIDEFVALEASGWKGSAGSAIASAAATDGFFRSAIAAAHGAGALCFTALRLDGRAIAMLITLIDGNAGFSFKTAFDEDLARFSPGVLLQRESLDILAARKLDWIDSCAAQDHPMIDSLWRERRTILCLTMPMPGRANRLIFDALQAAKQIWHRIKRTIEPFQAGWKHLAAWKRRQTNKLDPHFDSIKMNQGLAPLPALDKESEQ